MEKLLEEGQYENIDHLQNQEDIERVVKSLVEKQKAQLDRFHFHYSGLECIKIQNVKFYFIKAMEPAMLPYNLTSIPPKGNLPMLDSKL